MAHQPGLADADARRIALLEHGRSLLVEAGAGSGKTAVMAGRVVLMLAGGIAPASIAAVTFTELAAGELLQRVRDFAHSLCQGEVPAELALALPNGLSTAQTAHLQDAMEHLDELTCSTIHGFCQRLIMPYPVEAGIDPGASVLAAPQADAVFEDIVEQWLREELDKEDGGSLAPFLSDDLYALLDLVRRLAAVLRVHRNGAVPPAVNVEAKRKDWKSALSKFSLQMKDAGIVEGRSRAALDAARVFDALNASAASPAELLAADLPEAMFTKAGTLASLRIKGNWVAAAKVAGIATAAAEASLVAVLDAYQTCGEALLALRAEAASDMIAGLVEALRPVLFRYEQYKRSAAFLDFEDLIFSARALLRDHEAVRIALAARHAHVLVDEFQDTDAMQAEIFWTLCGESDVSAPGDWRARQIRPGALFLVGDPKQAIYRFRGADIAAYMSARDAYLRHDPGSVLSIATNFRSDEQILAFVNQRFAGPLSAAEQPGFTTLDAFNCGMPGPSVAAWDLPSEGEGASDVRSEEAEAVAELCQRLIGQYPIRQRTGSERPCRAADIALLAPMGTELWRYETALERRGISVISKAGKGFYRQQEVKDLVALVRVLADARDTLALGALLRGPLVGLTEEELLDIGWQLGQGGAPQRLNLWTDANLIAHPLARHMLVHLQELYSQSGSTTPALLLADALTRLRVRQVIMQRHGNQAERPLANIQQFLNKAGEYAVRGMAAFAADVNAAWEEGDSVAEGPRDTEEDAVTLFTMHASKGLEWPVVIPVNTSTKLMPASGEFVERGSGRIHCKAMGVEPAGYVDALDREKEDLAAERVRLWYVALTRPRQLLVLPRGACITGGTWNSVLGLDLAALPVLDLPDAPALKAVSPVAVASQSSSDFAGEEEAILHSQRIINWCNPSRSEGVAGMAVVVESVDGRIDASYPVLDVQGSRERGLVMHKLFEEVLNGETGDSQSALVARAHVLVGSLGAVPHSDASAGLSPDEIGERVAAALRLPEIAPLLPNMLAEYPLWSDTVDGSEEVVIAGVADAVSFDVAGRPHIIIDWKSDVAPTEQQLTLYRKQVAAYVAMAGAARGLLVLVSRGQVFEV